MAKQIKGINDKSGDIFRVFFDQPGVTRGDTIPIWLKLVDENNNPIGDITGYKLVFAFHTSLACTDPASLIIPEIEIPVGDAANSIFEGEITDDQTFSLPVAKIYGSIKYIKPDSRSYILDMAEFYVMPCVSTRRA